MKLIVLVALFLSACSTIKTVPTVEPTPTPLADPTPFPTATPMPGKIVTLSCDETCLDQERKEIPEIEAKLNETLKSKCFEDYFLDPKNALTMTDGLSREQVIEALRLPTKIKVSYYYKRWTKAVAYEDYRYPGTIFLNRAKVSGWTSCEKASTGGHEMSHAKGFKHNGNSPGPNQTTVPYQVNHAFEGYGNFAGCCK